MGGSEVPSAGQPQFGDGFAEGKVCSTMLCLIRRDVVARLPEKHLA
jgi:hypothetical protein